MKVTMEWEELQALAGGNGSLKVSEENAKLRAVVHEQRQQLKENEACIALLKDKLMLHQASLQTVDALLQEQSQRIRDIMADEPKDSGGWIPWAGGDCPVPDDTLVKVKLDDDGRYSIGLARIYDWNWEHQGKIIAYRIVEPKGAKADDGWIKWSGGDRPVSKPVKVEVQYRNGTTEIELSGDIAWWHGGQDVEWDIIAYRIVEPKAATDDDGWVAWAGGEQPVGDDVKVEVKLNNGKSHSSRANCFLWKHMSNDFYIIAYRIVDPKAATADDGWRRVGSECPFDNNPYVIVRYGDGRTSSGYADNFDWENDNDITECKLYTWPLW